MKRWCIAVVLIAALLLVGAAGAVKPVKEPVDKVVLIHYKDGVAAKPAPVLNAASFKLLGMKWKAFPVRYYVNPSNGDGLAPDAVTASVTSVLRDVGRRATSSQGPLQVRQGCPVSATRSRGTARTSSTGGRWGRELEHHRHHDRLVHPCHEGDRRDRHPDER